MRFGPRRRRIEAAPFPPDTLVSGRLEFESLGGSVKAGLDLVLEPAKDAADVLELTAALLRGQVPE